MKNIHKFLAAAAFITFVPAGAFAQTTYNGNGNDSFGNSIGQGSLTLSSDGTNLYGQIQLGSHNAFNDELVIYVDSTSGGFNSTSSFTDAGDTLRKAVSGYNGTNRATVNFSPGFGADYAIALSPARNHFGSVYTLDNTANFTYGTNGNNGSANLTPTYSNNGTNGDGIFTFTVPLALLGGATTFNFETTYLNGDDTYRSNEAFGNAIIDTDNPTNTGSPAQDTISIPSFSTFTVVPEPGTWLAGGLLVVASGVMAVRSRRAVA